MMTVDELSVRAMEIRKQFAELEKSRWGREWKVEDIALGLAGDVGDLVKLIQSKEGLRPPLEDIDARLAHELADCMWCLFVIANKYGLNLERAFMGTMAELEAWIERNKAKAGV
jgi:NTP pyrophosphatase (non-canonical NTP hydrolase)